MHYASNILILQASSLDFADGPLNETVLCVRGDRCPYGADRFLTSYSMKLIVSWRKKVTAAKRKA